MIVAFRADLKILRQLQIVDYFTAFGAFLPKTFRHFTLSIGSLLESRFLKDRHTSICGRR